MREGANFRIRIILRDIKASVISDPDSAHTFRWIDNSKAQGPIKFSPRRGSTVVLNSNGGTALVTNGATVSNSRKAKSIRRVVFLVSKTVRVFPACSPRILAGAACPAIDSDDAKSYYFSRAAADIPALRAHARARGWDKL